MIHRIEDIGTHANAITQIAFPEDTKIRNFYYDSRKVLVGKHSLFIALSTAHRDGHDFIKEAYDLGVRNFLVDTQYNITLKANYIIVDNTLTALQHYAKEYRKSLSTRIIGITGSNGKTIVKEWLKSVTKDHYAVFASPNSYNSQLGVAMSLLMIQDHHDLAFIECGISEKGEMIKLQDMVQPDEVIMTNIGDAHDGGFHTREEKLAEKLILTKNTRQIIFSDHHDFIKKHIIPSEKARSWSIDSQHDDQIVIKLIAQNQFLSFILPEGIIASHSVENLAHVIAFCAYNELLNHNKLQYEIKKLEKLDQRLSIRTNSTGLSILDDSFSCDLESMKISLSSFSRYIIPQKSFIVLTDFAEEHGDAHQKWKTLLPIINASNITRILFVGTQLNNFSHQVIPELIVVSNIVELYPHLDKMIGTYKSCLIKGASKYQLSKIINYLEDYKSHNTLHIDLEALRHNVDYYKRKLTPGTKCIAVIKANAYGSNAKIIAKELVLASIDYLAVAYLAEGIELRKSGITTPIIVLTPDLNNLELYEYYNLEPQVYDLAALNQLSRGSNLKIHLNLDTGMNRLGMKSLDLKAIESIKNKVKIESIYSHIRATEDMEDTSNTYHQVSLFLKMYDHISSILDYKPWKHILNSEGIINFPQYCFDAVRVGIGLYGISQNQNTVLRTTHRLESEIIQIKDVEVGETVGYGNQDIVQQSGYIAVIPLGYADGISRLLSQSDYQVYIGQKQYSIIGKISMDQLTIALGKDEYPVGTKVEIFGKNISLAKMATYAHTIPYELLCGLSSRIKRVFHKA